MNFKHTGVFPEQAANWDFIDDQIRRAGRPVSVLNLFAYTGGATLAAAAAGASVCHVDAAKGMVAWARENAAASGLSGAPIRWIIDDCAKFLQKYSLDSTLLEARTRPACISPGAKMACMFRRSKHRNLLLRT